VVGFPSVVYQIELVINAKAAMRCSKTLIPERKWGEHEKGTYRFSPGGLMSYGADTLDQFRKAAGHWGHTFSRKRGESGKKVRGRAGGRCISQT
jgi:hypothetical protein